MTKLEELKKAVVTSKDEAVASTIDATKALVIAKAADIARLEADDMVKREDRSWAIHRKAKLAYETELNKG